MDTSLARSTRLFVGFSAVAIFCGLGITARQSNVMAEMRVRGEQLERLVDASPSTRPPLWGEAQSGSAHAEYQRAIDLMSKTCGDDRQTIMHLIWEAPDGVVPAQAKALRAKFVAENQASLDALRKGAHCTDVSVDMGWETSRSPKISKLMSSRYLVNLAVLAAEHAVDQGDPQEGVNIMLDAMQFGVDVQKLPHAANEFIGGALFHIASFELLMERGMYLQLPPAELERAWEILGVLDRRLRAPSLAAEALLARVIRMADRGEGPGKLFDPESREGGMQSGYTATLQLAAMLEEELEIEERLQAVHTMEWGQAQAAFESASANESELGVLLCGNVRGSMERSRRRISASTQLLRAAIDLRLGRAIVDLRDPFGEELLVAEVAGGTQVRTVGPTGQIEAGRRRGLGVVVPR